MRKTSFLKVRTTPERLAQLKERAGKSGKAVSTFADEQLERALESVQQSEELAQLRSQMQELVAMVHTMHQQPTPVDFESQSMLREVRLIARELAMHNNAQILGRVAAQLKHQI